MPYFTEVENFEVQDNQAVFMEAVFGEDWPDKAYFVNEPEWGVRVRLDNLDHARGCFWCVGAIPWGKDRRNENVEDVRALVVDDVMTKVKWSDLWAALKPAGIEEDTFRTETSAGNFQHIFRFEVPPLVPAFNRFRHGLLGNVQGASDGKDAAHLFRLPWGVNRKEGREMFKVRGRFTQAQDHYEHCLDFKFRPAVRA